MENENTINSGELSKTPENTPAEQEKLRPESSVASVAEKIEEYFDATVPEEEVTPELKMEQWTAPEFDLENEIRRREGAFLEIAGPTQGGFDLVDLQALDRKIYESNVAPGVPLYNDQTGEFVGYVGKVDLQADATQLPIKDAKVGVLFASCLPIPIRDGALREAARVLEEDGLLIWQGAFKKDLPKAAKYGLEPKIYQRQIAENKSEDIPCNIVFQKRSFAK